MMKKIELKELENIKGGSCFGAGFFATVAIITAIPTSGGSLWSGWDYIQEAAACLD